MDKSIDYLKLKDQIIQLKAVAEKLDESGKTIPSVARNLARIMACVKMLALNIVDVLDSRKTIK